MEKARQFKFSQRDDDRAYKRLFLRGDRNVSSGYFQHQFLRLQSAKYSDQDATGATGVSATRARPAVRKYLSGTDRHGGIAEVATAEQHKLNSEQSHCPGVHTAFARPAGR